MLPCGRCCLSAGLEAPPYGVVPLSLRCGGCSLSAGREVTPYVCAAIMPLCYALQVRTAEDVCPYGLCLVFAYRPFDFYMFLHTATRFFTSFCIPSLNFCTILHTEPCFFTCFCIDPLFFCTILHTPRIFRKNCIDLMQKFTDFCAKISKIQCKNCTQK